MTVKHLLIAAAIAILAAGCARAGAVSRGRLDPGMQAAGSVLRLEQSEHPVTREQAAALLPLFSALRTTPAEDEPAARALAAQIERILTAEQRAALERTRGQPLPGSSGARSGGPSGGGPPGAGRPGGVRAPGQAPDPALLAGLRRQQLDRVIALLEARAK